MAFIIGEPETEEEVDVEEEGRFVIGEAPPQDEEFSLARTVVGSAAKGISGVAKPAEFAMDIGRKAITGDLDRLTGLSPDILRQKLLDKGYDETESEKIVQNLYGPRTSLDYMMGVSEGGILEGKNPLERVIQSAAGDLGEFIGWTALTGQPEGPQGLIGAGKSGALFGTGSQVAKEMGASPLVQFFTGLGTSGAPALFKVAKMGIDGIMKLGRNIFGARKLPEGTPQFLEEAGTRGSLADLQLSQRDLAGRVAKTSDAEMAKFDGMVGSTTEPAFKDMGTFRAADVEGEIATANKNAILDTISPVNATKKGGWETVQTVVEDNYTETKKLYRELYDIAEVEARPLVTEPIEAFEESVKLKGEMQGSLLKIAEEGSVKSAAENMVRGLIPGQEKNAAKLVEDLAKEGIPADYEEVVKMMRLLAEKGGPRETPLVQLMKTKRSIGRILAKSDILPAPVDLLKPLQRALKNDIVTGLEGNSTALDAFLGGENVFAQSRKTFDNDAIKKIRKSTEPEKLGSFFSSPSNLQALKKSIGSESKVTDFVDRMIVNEIASKETAAAREMARESERYMSEKAKKGLSQLIEYGDKKTPLGSAEVVRGNLLGDIQKSLAEGTRPTYALNLMKNPEGYSIVKNTLNTSKKGKEIFKGLQEMTVKDMMDSIISKETKQIDFEKARDIFSNPHLKKVVEESLGKEGLNFFLNLERMGKNMYKNLTELSKKEPKLFERLLDTYLGSHFKSMLAVFAPKAGVPLLLGGEAIKTLQRQRLFNQLSDPKVRNLIKNVSAPGNSTQQTKSAIKKLGAYSSKYEES